MLVRASNLKLNNNCLFFFKKENYKAISLRVYLHYSTKKKKSLKVASVP